MHIVNKPLWTPLASIALALSWLLPNAQPPWAAFHKDAFLALVLTLACFPMVLRAWKLRAESHLDWLSCYLMGLALLALSHWWMGKVDFLGQAFVGWLYFFAAGFAMYAGRLWTASSLGHVERFLFSAFVAAGIATAGMMYGQWAQIDMHPVWFNYLPPGERPYGNLNQANNAGSLLLLSLISLAWLMLTSKLRARVFLMAGVFVIGALVLTASRISFLSFVGLLVVAQILTWRLPRFRGYRWFPLILFLVFASIFLAQQYGWGEAAENSNPLRRDLAGIRMAAYSAFGEAIVSGPLTGFGFDQAVKAQLFAGQLGHKLPGLFGWTHNFVLDIAVWFGWPIALLGIAVGGWSVYQLRHLSVDSTAAASIACVIVLLMHGMVELPLTYAYYLLPLCLLIGALLGRAAIPSIRLPIPLSGAFLIGLSIALATIFVDYMRVETAFNAWRFKVARIGAIPDKIEAKFMVLDHFSVLIEGLDADPSQAQSFDMARFRSAVLSFPSPYALQRLVLLQAKSGDASGAKESVEVARLLTSKETNRDMAAQWAVWQRMDHEVAAVDWPSE